MAIVTKQNAQNQQNLDPDHMLRIRLKEIENSKKQIETNTNTITKMKRQLNSLGGSDGKGEANWETKYQEQVELKKQLELQIK